MNWPTRWGFIGDLKKCVGKTIAYVEQGRMESFAVHRNCWLVCFTDGARGFFMDRPTANIILSPSFKCMEESKIITQEEYGEALADHITKSQQRATQEVSQRRAKYEQLKREFEGSAYAVDEACSHRVVQNDED